MIRINDKRGEMNGYHIQGNLKLKIILHTDIQIHKHTNIQTYKYTNIQTYKHTKVQIYRQKPLKTLPPCQNWES